jgi:hypothetical protein
MTTTTETPSYSAALSREVRAEAARQGISGTALAHLIGISQPAMSDRLRGRVVWNVDEIGTIERVLSLETGTLFARMATELAVAGGRPPIGRYGDTPGHDTRNAWELAA